MDGVVVALRVLVSLAVVVGLVWYVARRLGGHGRDASQETEVRVLDRRSLSKHAGVAVIAAGDRRLLVGFADAGVQLITELAAVPPPAPASATPSPSTAAVPAARVAAERLASPAGLPSNHRPGLLAGSVLSRQTWHATVRTWQDRTVRR